MVSTKIARVFGVIAFSYAFVVVVLHELHRDAELGEDGIEHGVRAAVEVAGGYDLVPRLRQGDDGVVDRRGPGGQGNRGRAALQERDPLLQDVLRGIHDPV